MVHSVHEPCKPLSNIRIATDSRFCGVFAISYTRILAFPVPVCPPLQLLPFLVWIYLECYLLVEDTRPILLLLAAALSHFLVLPLFQPCLYPRLLHEKCRVQGQRQGGTSYLQPLHGARNMLR